MARARRKELMGVEITSEDGSRWTWRVGMRDFAWSPAGVLLAVQDDGTQRIVMHAPRIEGAVGYSAGWADGFEVGKIWSQSDRAQGN